MILASKLDGSVVERSVSRRPLAATFPAGPCACCSTRCQADAAPRPRARLYRAAAPTCCRLSWLAQVRQLSGGEQRRVGLALSLAFGELAAERGGLSCDFLVLDEVRSARGEGKNTTTRLDVFAMLQYMRAHGVEKVCSSFT